MRPQKTVLECPFCHKPTIEVLYTPGFVTTRQTPSWKEIFKNQFENPDEFTDWISTLFIEILFGNQDSSLIITWNRHKISHGATTRYGRLENTIRCFMILDFLSELS